jgi:hypothetical protein
VTIKTIRRRTRSRAATLFAAIAICISAAPSLQGSLFTGIGGVITAPEVAGGTTIDFDAGPTGLLAAITLANVTFFGVDAPITIGPDFIGQFNNTGVNSMFNGFDKVPTIFEFDFAQPVNAFGFDFGASDNTWRLDAYNKSNKLIESKLIRAVFASNAGDYAGIVDSGIAWARLTDTKDRKSDGDWVFIDNFTSVPEPSSLVLAALGLIGLVVWRRRKR